MVSEVADFKFVKSIYRLINKYDFLIFLVVSYPLVSPSYSVNALQRVKKREIAERDCLNWVCLQSTSVFRATLFYNSQ